MPGRIRDDVAVRGHTTVRHPFRIHRSSVRFASSVLAGALPPLFATLASFVSALVPLVMRVAEVAHVPLVGSHVAEVAAEVARVGAEILQPPEEVGV
jgi:hypothetical protein